MRPQPVAVLQAEAVTRQLADAGRVVGVELLDHVVIGRPEADPAGKGWFSFGEAGLI